MFGVNQLIGFAVNTVQSLLTATTGTFGQSETANLALNGSFPHGGLKFTAPATGAVTQVKIRTITVVASGSWEARLYTNNAGSPGTQIGSSSGAQTVSADATNYTFVFGSPPSITNGTAYWIVITPVSGTPAFGVSCCNDQAGYGSGREATITAITDSLEGISDIRMEITYQY